MGSCGCSEVLLEDVVRKFTRHFNRSARCPEVHSHLLLGEIGGVGSLLGGGCDEFLGEIEVTFDVERSVRDEVKRDQRIAILFF